MAMATPEIKMTNWEDTYFILLINLSSLGIFILVKNKKV